MQAERRGVAWHTLKQCENFKGLGALAAAAAECADISTHGIQFNAIAVIRQRLSSLPRAIPAAEGSHAAAGATRARGGSERSRVTTVTCRSCTTGRTG